MDIAKADRAVHARAIGRHEVTRQHPSHFEPSPRCVMIRAKGTMHGVAQMSINRRNCLSLMAAAAARPAWSQLSEQRSIAVLFESLISPFFVAAIERFRAQIKSRGWTILEALSNSNDERQFQQVESMIKRKVNGIILVHTDDKAVVPAIRAANAAHIPMVHFNRRPAPSDAYSVAVVADNRKLMDDTVSALIGMAQQKGGKYQAALLVGNMNDANAVQRRDGFEAAVARHKETIDVVARISTEWNAEKALAGFTAALQEHPDINMLVSSSDFLTPQIERALRAAGKWFPANHPKHVLVAGFDGDDLGYAQLAAGYYDVDGVQNLDYEVKTSLEALEQMWAGERPEKTLIDPGLVISRNTLRFKRDSMWGYGVWRAKNLSTGG